MKEGNWVFINDLRKSKEEPAVMQGRIRFISDKEDYTDIWLDTGYQITIKKKET